MCQKEFGEELQKGEVQVKPRGQPNAPGSSSTKGRSILGGGLLNSHGCSDGRKHMRVVVPTHGSSGELISHSSPPMQPVTECLKCHWHEDIDSPSWEFMATSVLGNTSVTSH